MSGSFAASGRRRPCALFAHASSPCPAVKAKQRAAFTNQVARNGPELAFLEQKLGLSIRGKARAYRPCSLTPRYSGVLCCGAQTCSDTRKRGCWPADVVQFTFHNIDSASFHRTFSIDLDASKAQYTGAYSLCSVRLETKGSRNHSGNSSFLSTIIASARTQSRPSPLPPSSLRPSSRLSSRRSTRPGTCTSSSSRSGTPSSTKSRSRRRASRASWRGRRNGNGSGKGARGRKSSGRRESEYRKRSRSKG